MELNKRDINFQAEVHRLFGENQILLHQKNKLINELDQYKTAHNKLTAGLKEAVAESIKYKRERDEYELKLQNISGVFKKVSKELEKEADMTLKLEGQLHDMTKQRDSLIKDVAKLREEKEDLKRLGYETYKDAVKYKTLTEHIKDKALNNPSEHRYFRLVHFIDDLEADTND